MEREITKRMVLHTGFSCNERCRFCYYRESLERGDTKDLSTKEVKHRLELGRRYGKDSVDFTGGEPTIRKDIFEIIEYARSIGYGTICIITNGLTMNDYGFCKKLKEAGLNDVLFSVHSASPELHDYLTSVKGSWGKIINAMKNAKRLGINIRINTVVNNLNYNNLEQYFGLMKKLKPNIINLLVFNPAEEAVKYREDNVAVADYAEVGKKLADALKRHGKGHSQINVRFLPFCLLKPHERNIRTLWQIMYEREEWDPILFIRFRKGMLYVPFFTIVGFLAALLNPRYYSLPFTGKKTVYTFWGELIRAAHVFHNYKHIKDCYNCSLRKICPGLNRAYIKKFAKSVKINLLPYEMEIIKNPLHFCKDKGE